MGRDVPAIIVSQYDRRRYRDKVRRCLDVFARMLQDARFKEAPQQVGLEAEFYLVDGAGDVSERAAEVLAAIGAGDWAPELGKFNLEVNLAPRPLADEALGGLERDLADSVAYADGRARSAGARPSTMNTRVSLRLGKECINCGMGGVGYLRSTWIRKCSIARSTPATSASTPTIHKGSAIPRMRFRPKTTRKRARNR